MDPSNLFLSYIIHHFCCNAGSWWYFLHILTEILMPCKAVLGTMNRKRSVIAHTVALHIHLVLKNSTCLGTQLLFWASITAGYFVEKQSQGLKGRQFRFVTVIKSEHLNSSDMESKTFQSLDHVKHGGVPQSSSHSQRAWR